MNNLETVDELLNFLKKNGVDIYRLNITIDDEDDYMEVIKENRNADNTVNTKNLQYNSGVFDTINWIEKKAESDKSRRLPRVV